ncbi:hypothetical protein ACPV47_16205 [Vibrio jasicida]|uniref:T4 family baseplate hub assembly chaperone n=1 Tax=Vibrio jasicida TaxID=766224 RepID=UPI004067DE34
MNKKFDLSILKTPVKKIQLPVSRKDVEVRIPNVKELQEISTNKKKAEQYKSLNSFVTGCSFEELCLADSELLTMIIYSESTKDTWGVFVDCPSCGKDIEVEYHVDDIKISSQPDNFINYDLINLSFDLQTPTMIQLCEVQEPSKDSELSDVDIIEFDNAIRLCKKLVTKINHNGIEYKLNEDELDEFVDNLPYYLTNKMFIFIQDQSHIMTDVSLKCSCGYEDTGTLRRLKEHLL